MQLEVPPPSSLLRPLKVPCQILMGPGPSNCPPRVLHAGGLPVIGHMHAFFPVMDDIKEGIQYIFQTKTPYVLAISGPGHAAMEAGIGNLVEPGDVIAVGVNGIWGNRIADMVERHGGDARRLEKEIGNNFSLSEISTFLQCHRPKLLFLTHGESSAGVIQPLEGVGPLCHSYNCLLMVDTVASLGGVPVHMDKLGIDCLYSGSQKVIGAPPGTAPIAFSLAARDKILSRKTKTHSMFLDMNWLWNYWNCDTKEPRAYHHTPPVTNMYALREGLAMVAEEGLEHCWNRHKVCSERLHDGLKKMGLRFFVDDPSARLPTVTTIAIPEGLNWKAVIAYAMEKYSVEIAGGLGPTIGKVWRIGVMGYNAYPEKVDLVLKALQEGLEYAKKVKPFNGHL